MQWQRLLLNNFKMKASLLILLFVAIGLICHAQKELLVISRKDSTKQIRILKGAVLRVKTLSRQKYSGTLVALKNTKLFCGTTQLTLMLMKLNT